jgi:hypothetical protein
MAETKPKAVSSLRTPQLKKKLGLSVPPALRLPHEDLISPRVEHEISMPAPSSEPSQTTSTSMTRPTNQPTPISPSRDYTKVANSIGREAVPAGLFTGKSKQLYDCLYSLTRGAVVPSRVVRISRPRLMKKAGIGARVTFDANVERLVSVGLIQVRKITGEHEGNEYTVFMPEELSMPSQTSHSSQSSLTSHAWNLDRLDRLESSQTRHSLFVENTSTSDESKTFYKTSTGSDDDEAFAVMVSTFKQAVAELTGKTSSPAEAERWRDLAELLVVELKIAASRTTVSSVPAFLTEHLRRRLWKKDKAQLDREEKQTPPAEPQVDASKCLDCGGSGWYYPDGQERGVAKCKHVMQPQGES